MTMKVHTTVLLLAVTFGIYCHLYSTKAVTGSDLDITKYFPNINNLATASEPSSIRETHASASSNHAPLSVRELLHGRTIWPHNLHVALQDLVATDQSTETCQLAGFVDDCCTILLSPISNSASYGAHHAHAHVAGNCTYQSVDSLNQNHVHGIVSKLTKLPFFRFFKVNIYCDCPLWPEDGMCAMQACSVCECEESEVPAPWLAQEKRLEQAQACTADTCDRSKCIAEVDSMVDRTVEPEIQARLLSLKGWRGLNNPWMAEGEEDEEYLYINLLVNPERYTGYNGEHAHRIWSAIYNQSCFDGITSPGILGDDTCTEKRVFYRLISGMHASISAHLSAEWLLDEMRGLWGPNLEEFRSRLGTPDVRYRVQNLYFAYLFVLRAVMKAAPQLQRFEYTTGFVLEDKMTQGLMNELLGSQQLYNSCPVPFDEGRLWKGTEGPQLRAQIQASFRNITRIMDCVGCEKCKMWGKLQTLGIATALKILFSEDDCQGSSPPVGQRTSDLNLERNEVIALINLLERFSKSLEIYRTLSMQLQQEEGLNRSLPAADAVA